jgi:hypothetical protein
MSAILTLCECTPPSDPFSPMNKHQNWIIAHLLLLTCKRIPSPNLNHGIEREALLFLPAKGGGRRLSFLIYYWGILVYKKF